MLSSYAVGTMARKRHSLGDRLGCSAEMLSLRSRLAAHDRVVFRGTSRGAMLVDLASGECFELNQVGAEAWAHLEAGVSLDEVVKALEVKYQAPGADVAADVLAVCNALVDAGLMIERPAPSGEPR